MNNFNQPQVEDTLRLVTKIFHQKQVGYLFMGSILPTALNGKLYRRVNDFDILIDISDLNKVVPELQANGFYRKTKNYFRISELLNLYEFYHPKLLEVGFFAINFSDHPCLEAGPFRVDINPKALKKTKYSFANINFWGIPAPAAYRLALYAKSNPKRKIEFQIYKQHQIKQFDERPYDLYFLNLKINWLLEVMNFALVVIGNLRVTLGKPYDLWR